MTLRRAIFQVKGYDDVAVNAAVEQARRIAGKMGLSVSGHVYLPRVTKKWTVLKSAFVHKKARHQWEMRTQRQLFTIEAPPEHETAFFHFINGYRNHLAPSVGMRIRTEEIALPRDVAAKHAEKTSTETSQQQNTASQASAGQ